MVTSLGRAAAIQAGRDGSSEVQRDAGKLVRTVTSGFLSFVAAGCRTHSRRPPRSSDGDRPTASRRVVQTHHDIERSAGVVADHALILYNMLGDALILRRDLTIGHLLHGQGEATLVAHARRAVIRPPEIPGAVRSE